ncbi:MAG TPA: phosphoenolpyruvate--protein phosphotransferase [Pyrinomonadaceae bacterium]|nr:phosphoenolpyruvate--protein phosphotransferase [Pyrinomonadaceae bacterium]
MIKQHLTVTSRLGLHARAAAKLVRIAGQFKSAVKLQRADGSISADAKSILSVLMLAATRGTDLVLLADGVDEKDALQAVLALFADEFGETDRIVFHHAAANQEESRRKGLGVSEGVVIGRVLRLHNGARTVYRARVDEADVQRELRRFRAAVRIARKQLRAIKQRAEQELGRSHAYIFDAHLLFLEDAQLIEEVEDHITRESANAEWAVKVVGDRLLSVYSEIKDEYLRERGSDIEDVVQRLLVNLSGERPQYRSLSVDAVIVSPDLLPSTVAELDLQRARAIATDTGGWTSHMAIIARGLGIPAVVGLRDFFRRTRTGDKIIVDSFHGEVILHPTPETVERYQAEAQKRVSRSVDPAPAQEPVITSDGVEVRLRANVELAAEFGGITKYGASGIGLYRSEFLLTRPGVMLAEDEQYEAYKSLSDVAGKGGAIVRLFDLGGREILDETEKNPALGLRAIRFDLRNEEMMRTQLRAILRAATGGNLDLVLPMVADVGDVRRSREMLEEESRKLQAEGTAYGPVKVGAMIEVPSAVLMAEQIARAVDFFELGTNDLVQYTLAVDRGNDNVSEWFRTLHPAVLSSIDQTLRVAKQAGIPVIVCGEMASTPAYAVLLVGFGAIDLSMTPSSIPRVRQAISQIDSRDARNIAERVLSCETADEVEELVREELGTRWPNLFPPESLPAPRKRS